MAVRPSARSLGRKWQLSEGLSRDARNGHRLPSVYSSMKDFALQYGTKLYRRSVLMIWRQFGPQSPRTPCLEEDKCWVLPKEHKPHSQAWRWKYCTLGLFFCYRMTSNWGTSGQRPCTVKSLKTTSFPQPELQWVMNDMNDKQQPVNLKDLESFSKKEWAKNPS